MKLESIIASAAAYLGKTSADLTVNAVDLGLVALNQVRKNAELNHDFEFSRKLLTLDVDGITGGSLDEAVEYGTDDVYEVKTLLDVGQFDETGNLLPVEWTTLGEGLIRQRMENPRYSARYPTDAEAVSGPIGQRRFVFSGGSVYFYPKVVNTMFTVGMEAYTFVPDWVKADLTTEVTPWATHGQQYLLWGTVMHLNNLFKEFVFRQEGNLPPPKDLTDAGLSSLIAWDTFKFEQFRRHGR